MYVHFTLHPSYGVIVSSLVFNIITFTDIIISCDYIDLGSNTSLDKQISQLVKSLAKINLYAFRLPKSISMLYDGGFKINISMSVYKLYSRQSLFKQPKFLSSSSDSSRTGTMIQRHFDRATRLRLFDLLSCLSRLAGIFTFYSSSSDR